MTSDFAAGRSISQSNTLGAKLLFQPIQTRHRRLSLLVIHPTSRQLCCSHQPRLPSPVSSNLCTRKASTRPGRGPRSLACSGEGHLSASFLALIQDTAPGQKYSALQKTTSLSYIVSPLFIRIPLIVPGPDPVPAAYHPNPPTTSYNPSSAPALDSGSSNIFGAAVTATKSRNVGGRETTENPPYCRGERSAQWPCKSSAQTIGILAVACHSVCCLATAATATSSTPHTP